MWVEHLQVHGLRCLEALDLHPDRGCNWLLGPNGAGKTSVLEALHLLSHGRSFRQGARDNLIARSGDQLRIFSQVADDAGGRHRLGLEIAKGGLEARMDGSRVARITDLLHRCAVVCFEPGSHALIAGPAEERRQFMDWGVFHVEHGFVEAWQRYRRAWRQRNRLLREANRPDAALFAPWNLEMDAAANHMDRQRKAYLDALLPVLRGLAEQFIPELGGLSLRYRRGWDEEACLLDVLENQLERDRARGHTLFGPQRADWKLVFEHAPLRDHLSRGQEKLCALTCLLAQASLHKIRQGGWPILCLDDLASELDAPHQSAVLDWLPDHEAQVFITGTHADPGVTGQGSVFHVEQGKLSRI